MKSAVPFTGNSYQYQEIRKDVNQKWRQIFARGNFFTNKYTTIFEKNFARFCSTRHAQLVASGTDALYLSLLAAGITKGDEVITPSFTFAATALAVIKVGAIPVFIDIDSKTFTLAASQIEDKLTSKTKAILPVHLYGQMADMAPIMRLAKTFKLKVIEDACQAHGALYHNKPAGSLGDLAAFSFYPTKNLGSYSDCGAITTSSEKYAQHLKKLANYGFKTKYISEEFGINSRSDELQAVWLSESLKRLKKWNAKRVQLAKEYLIKLAGLPLTLPFVAQGRTHVFHIFAVRTPKRDQLQKYLAHKGIPSLVHYPVPLHLQPYFKFLPKVKLPHSENAAREVLSLPIYPQMSSPTHDYICSTIRDFFK